MKQTTTVMNYDFNKSYYENFLRNRVAGITGSGSINTTMKQLFFPNMVTIKLKNGVIDPTGEECVGHIDFKNYVKRVYNNDKPVCIDEKIKQEIQNAKDDISKWDDEAANWVDNALGTSFSKVKIF